MTTPPTKPGDVLSAKEHNHALTRLCTAARVEHLPDTDDAWNTLAAHDLELRRQLAEAEARAEKAEESFQLCESAAESSDERIATPERDLAVWKERVGEAKRSETYAWERHGDLAKNARISLEALTIERDTAVRERDDIKARNENQLLIVVTTRRERDDLRAKLARAIEALDAIRDSVLHDRGPLADAEMTSDQTNAVLALIDDNMPGVAEHDKDESTPGGNAGQTAGQECALAPESMPPSPGVEQSKPGADRRHHSSCACSDAGPCAFHEILIPEDRPAPPKTEAPTCLECGRAESHYCPTIGHGPARAELIAALREIVEALRCRTVHMGYACNRYEATYAESSDDPVKSARALLARLDKDAGR
jgi:hypothetical protein